MDKEPDKKYMERALQLALLGAGHVSPNPMVGAVIAAPDGRIIGEGYHRRYGGPHAEVNAFASVRPCDEHLLKDSTIYVTLEPCSHYGKTPPCARLLCDKGIARAVMGTTDPNPKVAGRGTAMLREAGIEVTEDFMRDECRAVNRRFFKAHTSDRPHILLKWARSADGFIAGPEGEPIRLSSAATLPLMHRERALCDAILAGTGTLRTDNPSLTVRLWPGNSPKPVMFRSDSLSDFTPKILERDPIMLDPKLPLEENMRILRRDYGVTSLMVEGGPRLLQSFIDAGLYDEIRVETAAFETKDGIAAPALPVGTELTDSKKIAGRTQCEGGAEVY